MKLMTKYLLLALMGLALQSCGSSNLGKDEKELLSRSALYDPPTITLFPGRLYRFQEGDYQGAGQRFHSQYSYQRALIMGKN